MGQYQYNTNMESESYVSCLAWIHKGFAANVPREIQLTEQEIEQMKADPMVAEGYLQSVCRLMEGEMDEEDDDMPVFGDNVRQVMQKGGYPMGAEELSDDEKEDYYIKDTDALIVAGKIEKDYSSLEVYVYEQDRNNLFVHHEIMLSAFPLDIQWLKVNLGSINSNQPSKGNYAIVASFLPEIEIWNLDLTEAIQPDVILGGEIEQKKKKVKKFTNQNKKYKPGSHTDAITSLSLNHSNLSVLASGSVDSTVKIWDISKEVCVHTASHHTGEVKKVQWSTLDVSVILTAGGDNTICVLDSRFPADHIAHKMPEGQDVESACWNINNQSQIAYTTSQGNLYVFDVRKSSQPLIGQRAHSSRVNDLKITSKNMCFTCSQDNNVRVWNLADLTEPIASKNPKCGVLMCLQLMEEKDGPVVGCGNSKGELFVWDATENQKVSEYWSTH